jgi:hypothetical protein
MVRRGEDLGIDGAVAGEAGQIMIGQPGTVTPAGTSEEIAGRRRGEIVLDERPF